MSRKPVSLAALVILIAATQGRGQTSPSPSLGDLARQLRSEKSAAQQKKVLTNDDLGSSAGIGDFKFVEPGDPKAGSAAPASVSSPSLDQAKSTLDRMDMLLIQVDSLDRATLVKSVLAGKDANFPGHDAWEQRLLASRQTYVTQGRELIQEGRRYLESVQSLEAAHATPDDPRVQTLNAKLKQFVQDCVQTGSAFQAVVLEGRDLANQAPVQTPAQDPPH